MKTSKKGIDLIKSFEGFRAKPYICAGGKWTIGYGHTAGVTSVSPSITKANAEELLRDDLEYFEQQVNRLVKVPLTQPQFDALVSFTYNVGVSNFMNSTLRYLLNHGVFSKAANAFLRWCYANGKKLPGLERRRQAERSLFLETSDDTE